MSDAESRDADWPLARWGRILDRVELRQAARGLKFWGPPLWLEVTMTGPDSDRWPANPEGNDSWNWLSTEACFEAERLLVQGADDDQLVVAVGRYTVENLILNAVHEIGEWLRFDGRRVFPLRELAGPSRFTYLPGTAVQYHAAGPVIRLHSNGASTTGWRSMWSPATLDAVRNDADAETLIGAVQRDVHGAVVAWEADRICRAFYIDRRRPWRLAAPESLGAEPAADDEEVDDILTLTIAYLDPEEIDA